VFKVARLVQRRGSCSRDATSRVPRRTDRPPDPVARAFGAAVRRTRDETGMTLEAVAAKIARVNREGQTITMDSKYLSSLEGGWHSPTITTAKQIADALDVPLGQLVHDL